MNVIKYRNSILIQTKDKVGWGAGTGASPFASGLPETLTRTHMQRDHVLRRGFITEPKSRLTCKKHKPEQGVVRP